MTRSEWGEGGPVESDAAAGDEAQHGSPLRIVDAHCRHLCLHRSSDLVVLRPSAHSLRRTSSRQMSSVASTSYTTPIRRAATSDEATREKVESFNAKLLVSRTKGKAAAGGEVREFTHQYANICAFPSLALRARWTWCYRLYEARSAQTPSARNG